MTKYGIILFLFISCTGSNCKDLPNNFESYNQVKETIKETNFEFEDQVNTSRSSWITSAKYFSCDSKTGFLVIGTESEDYIYGGVSIEIWNEFKNSESLGSYYNSTIKHRYQLKIKPSGKRKNL
ncbi:MAG: KTSC domain-containing protein [Flavobacterium sp.]